ncbi:hypothetical protein C2845_PM10G13480 [Panicum miliaceum]|uniref:Uncharacterized protein n=1 Tax=Panicum miliaceum TaxID=4540 RepID=A0A3L6PIK0_PANMI|nr:hypothetical protein C2845_PM10G13480 [Panicum miliaceum]
MTAPLPPSSLLAILPAGSSDCGGAASQPADQHATLMSRLGAKVEAPSSGEIKNYRFRSDVPSPPSHTAVGGPASLLPKRKPLTEEEIEAIMVFPLFTEAEIHLEMLYLFLVFVVLHLLQFVGI